MSNKIECNFTLINEEIIEALELALRKLNDNLKRITNLDEQFKDEVILRYEKQYTSEVAGLKEILIDLKFKVGA